MPDPAPSERPIRVALVCLGAYPLFHPELGAPHGGAEVDTYLLARELAAGGGFEPAVIVGDYGQPPREPAEGVLLLRTPKLSRRPVAAASGIWRALREFQPDAVFREGASLVTVLTGAYCRRAGVPLVYRSANTGECDGTYLRRHRLLRGPLYRRLLRQSQAVIVQNESDRAAMLASAGVEATVIPNGFDLSASPSSDRRYVLWVGRSAPVKRPELFVRLARELPDERFCMICQPGKAGQTPEQLGVAGVPNLEFLPGVPFQEVDRYFARAKLLVNTSDSEGFPNAFIQACKAGTGILSLNANPDGFLDRHECGACADGDWGKFVASLRGMLAEGRYEALGRSARKYAEQRHDLGKIIPVYRDLFRRLAGR